MKNYIVLASFALLWWIPSSSFRTPRLLVLRQSNSAQNSLYIHQFKSRVFSIPSSSSSEDQPPLPIDQFAAELTEALGSKSLFKLALSENKNIADPESEVYNLKAVVGRLVEIKSGLKVQFVYKYTTNDQTKNFDLVDAPGKITQHLKAGFKRATFTTADGTSCELNLKRGSHGKFRKSSKIEKSVVGATSPSDNEEVPNPETAVAAALVDLTHDRKKDLLISSEAPFLRALKVTTDGGRPLTGMSNKLRQIQKFVEIVAGLVSKSDAISSRRSQAAAADESSDIKPQLRIVDMGSGLAYLTFAVHSYLSQQFALDTIGVEARPALVEQTNKIARDLGNDFDGLRFLPGLITDFQSLSLSLEAVPSTGARDPNQMDILIALHACDTATDDAIWAGIEGGAEIIVTAPCCHKQVRSQLDRQAVNLAKTGSKKGASGTMENSDDDDDDANSSRALSSGLGELLSHGIFREREAEMVTDTIRALLLEYAGYTTSVFEFVGGEHTAKNVMIAAVKRRAGSAVSSDGNSDAVVPKKKRASKSSFKEEEEEEEGVLLASSTVSAREDEYREKIRRKISDVMLTFGVKQHKLVDLVLNQDNAGTSKDTAEEKRQTAKTRKLRKLSSKDLSAPVDNWLESA